MNKAEEQQFAILSSNYRSEQEERRKAQKKASLLEQENSVLKSKNEDMQRQLNEKMDEVADTVRQMAQFMMGKGPVTLSDSLRDAIVAGVREEFEAKLREERDAHEKAIQSLNYPTDSMDLGDDLIKFWLEKNLISKIVYGRLMRHEL